MRTGYLIKDYREKITSKRAWMVKAWRIVDETGLDLVQPWLTDKAEAVSVAKELHIKLLAHDRNKKPIVAKNPEK